LYARNFAITRNKILDFSRLLPGPLGTHMLSQMGAEIIKIASSKRMDYCRFYQPQINGVSTLFHTLNHCKNPGRLATDCGTG
jgi:crotonobetainyl-CoA:carnitine CoA-transferase CaiB-like acyl-CoA transferase